MKVQVARGLSLVAATAALLAGGCRCGVDEGAIDDLRCGAPYECEAGLECRAGYCRVPRCEPACSEGQTCVDRRCVCQDPSLTACGSACARTTSDPEHCGACVSVCAEGHVCQDGTCQQSCDPGYTDCAGACAELSDDRMFCGTCDNRCIGADVCLNGTCGTCESASNCDDGLECTVDDCRDGACLNVLVEGDCIVAGECLSDGDPCGDDGGVCTPCAGGCAEPPSRFTMSCTDGEPGGAPAICTLSLDQPTTAACIACNPLAGMTELLRSDFSDCDLSGWTVTGEPPICPLEDGTLFAGMDADALEADDATWSIEREVDTSDFDTARLCFDYAQRAADDHQQFVVSVRTAEAWTEAFSDTAPILDVRGPAWITRCVVLGAGAAPNPSLGIRFTLTAANDKDLYLDDVFLDAWVRGDLTEQVPIDDGFGGCETGRWTVDTVEGNPPVCPTNASGWPEARDALEASDGTWRISRSAGERICEDPWLELAYGNSDPDHGERLAVEMDFGDGWHLVWGNNLGISPNHTFGNVEIGLAHADVRARDAANLSVLFDLRADGGEDKTLAIDDVELRGFACGDASDRVELSAVGWMTDMAYSFAVTTAQQMTVHPVCTWAGRPEVTATGRATLRR